MKVCGFTIIRNAVKYDYPVVESITSVLDVCDQFLVSVGNSEDDTLGLIRSINSPKIKIIESVWDDTLREGGKVLAVETNKCMDAIGDEFDWCFYLQADEVVHEKYLPSVLTAMTKHVNNKAVDGLLFRYLHFYGTYDYVGDSRTWYRNEVRIIRNNKQIRSFRDAQGFKINGKLLKVKETGAQIYHYGWVKPPEKQQQKQKDFHKLWHDDQWIEQNTSQHQVFDYSKYDSLKLFHDTHPAVMKDRIERLNWKANIDPGKKKHKNLIKWFQYVVEKKTGYRIGEYKNYKKI